MSKLSFQYGLSVFLITDVVRVCSPDSVATAKGSGNPAMICISDVRSFFNRRLTEDIALVQTIGRDDYVL